MTILAELLEITVYSALLYGALMGFRRLTRDRVSARVRHMLWFLLAARLLLPVTLAAPLALFTLPETPSVVQATLAQAPQPADITAMVQAPDVPQNVSLAGGMPKATAVPAATQPLSLWDALRHAWPHLLLGLWLTGTLMMAANLLRLAVLRNRRLRKECVAPPAALERQMRRLALAMGLRRCPRLALFPAIASPCLATGLRPALLLPADMAERFTFEQIAFALGHELTHYRHRDDLVELLWSILRCIHWFNPFVWLALRAVREDMELACDSALVRAMGADERKRYAQTLLALFCRSERPALVLGMAQGGVRRTAEARIRGVFSPGTSAKGMKALSAALALALLVGCFTTACQPTPAKPAVVNKNDGKLEEKLTQTATPLPSRSTAPESSASAPATPTLRSRMGIPETWQYEKSSDDGAVKVQIDATVVVPDVAKAAVYRAKIASFTVEQIEKMDQVLLGGAQLCEPGDPPPEYWQGQIILDQQEIDSAKKSGNKDHQKKMESVLADAKKQYAKAVKAKEPQPLKTLAFQAEGSDVQVIHASATLNGRAMAMMAANSSYMSQVQLGLADDSGQNPCWFGEVPSAQPDGVQMTIDQALEQAKNWMAQIDPDLHWVSVAPGCDNSADQHSLWLVTFTNAYDGMLSNDYAHYIDESEATNDISDYEKIVVGLDDKGFANLRWQAPLAITETINADAALMSFPEMQDTIAQALYHNAQGGAYDPKVERIALGLTRVAYKDHPGEYLLVPSWDIYGLPLIAASASGDKKQDDKAVRLLLTINALDGSIIDTKKGY